MTNDLKQVKLCAWCWHPKRDDGARGVKFITVEHRTFYSPSTGICSTCIKEKRHL